MRLGHARVDLAIEPFRRPLGCQLLDCIALADGNAEVARLHVAEARLAEALGRERALLVEKQALVQHTELLGREADHRLLNGLQMVSSLLSLQARQAEEPGVAAQLREAARRVVAVASVHGSLHSLDQAENVELKGYLVTLGQKLASLVSADVKQGDLAIEAVELHVPAAMGATLGLIVSELVTNSTKYATGKIAIRLATHADGYALSVTDEGPGLPQGFDPAKTSGLGMKIISSLVQKVGGRLAIGAGDAGRGTTFTVIFNVE